MPKTILCGLFCPEEVMDESTATILDAHVAQLERELSILIYDIQDLENQGRGSQMRQMFVLFPKRLQEWEFLHPSLSFCLPREPRCSHTDGAGSLEAYTELLVSLNTYTTPTTKTSVERWKSMLMPFTLGLTEILEGQSTLKDSETERLNRVKQRSIDEQE